MDAHMSRREEARHLLEIARQKVRAIIIVRQKQTSAGYQKRHGVLDNGIHANLTSGGDQSSAPPRAMPNFGSGNVNTLVT